MPSTVSPKEVDGSTAAWDPNKRKQDELTRPERDPDRNFEVPTETDEDPVTFVVGKWYLEPRISSLWFLGERWWDWGGEREEKKQVKKWRLRLGFWERSDDLLSMEDDIFSVREGLGVLGQGLMEVDGLTNDGNALSDS